jgi:3-oxoacyl-[acyl-carrier protein] reductase
MQSLLDKKALVSGSSRGIGAAIAARLAADGATVVVHYGSEREGAQKVHEAIVGAGGQSAVVQADLATPEGPQQMVDRATALVGELDILVNNAGIFARGPIAEYDAAAIDRVFAINVRGLLLATKAFVGATHTKHGRIVNIGSVAARSPAAGYAVYASSKAALAAITRSHAAELGARGFTVNAIAPGATLTDMGASAFSPEFQAAIVRGTALGRFGDPADIAKAVALLCGDDAKWITAQVIEVDGGMLTTAGTIAKLVGLA